MAAKVRTTSCQGHASDANALPSTITDASDSVTLDSSRDVYSRSHQTKVLTQFRNSLQWMQRLCVATMPLLAIAMLYICATSLQSSLSSLSGVQEVLPCSHQGASRGLTAADTFLAQDVEVHSRAMGHRALRGTSRVLQQEGSANITVVRTADELLEAVVGGDPHIEIRAHLNLTTLAGVDTGDGSYLLGPIPSTGNCEGVDPPSPELLNATHVGLRPLLPRQCVLYADHNLMWLIGTKLWLDALYVRLTAPRNADGFSQLLYLGRISEFSDEEELWMTDVTLQGNGDGDPDCDFCGMHLVHGAKVYAQGFAVTDFDTYAVAGAYSGSIVSLVDCAFEGNTLYPLVWGAAVFEAESDADSGPVAVRLQGCTFDNTLNDGVPTLLRDKRDKVAVVEFFSDSPTPEVCTYEGEDESAEPPPCIFTPPLPLEQAGDVYLTLANPWLIQTQQAHALPGDPPPATPEDPIRSAGGASERSSGPGVDVIAGATVAGIAVAALAAVGLFILMRRRRTPPGNGTTAEGKPGTESTATTLPNTTDETEAQKSEGPPAGATDTTSAVIPNKHVTPALPLAMTSHGSSANAVGGSTAEATGTTTAGSTSLKPWTARKVPPSAGAEGSTRMKYIHQILDCLGPDHILLGRYQLLGSSERRTGGQSVVQFARRIDGTGAALHALKFFAKRQDYDEEVNIYKDAPVQLKRFMPAVNKYVDNLDGAVKDPLGNHVPPFIIMEKGESLSDRAQYMPVDLFTAAQVLGHVSERIAELHDAGYVHRDLKPGNIMWQPRNYSWVLIDFGIASAIGEQAPVAYTLAYAAPETVVARQRGDKQVTADAAVDAWALGVIAFELLVQHPAFGFLPDMGQAYKDLLDPDQPLPWDEGRVSAQDLKKLGRFRKPIMNLLQRDPVKRVTVRQFSEDVQGMFADQDAAAAEPAPGDASAPVQMPEQPAASGKLQNPLTL